MNARERLWTAIRDVLDDRVGADEVTNAVEAVLPDLLTDPEFIERVGMGAVYDIEAARLVLTDAARAITGDKP